MAKLKRGVIANEVHKATKQGVIVAKDYVVRLYGRGIYRLAELGGDWLMSGPIDEIVDRIIRGKRPS